MQHIPALVVLLLAVSEVPAQDLANGREIHAICAGCHGKHAQGGKGGEYPRLAGQRAAYIEEQLYAFRSRKRLNIPMLPYTSERELPDSDVTDIAAYLASLRLHVRPPSFIDAADAVRRREELDKVLVVDTVDGDVTQGRGIYDAECANCHAKNGRGRSSFPMLVGQYPRYLMRQLAAYRRGDRAHDESDPGKGVLMPLNDTDLRNILAYLTSIQDRDD